MRIEHLAIWTKDLEGMREFYETFFSVTANEKYYNPKTGFSSYFLAFKNGARIELMHRPDIKQIGQAPGMILGISHFAISLGSKDSVDQLTNRLRASGFTILGEARTTGDGYYESVVADPEGNRIELTV
jgi:lactoylglutathione lyase